MRWPLTPCALQNQKKSWHTQTFKNKERVWKAEQRDEEERKKAEVLRKELEDERRREDLVRLQEDVGLKYVSFRFPCAPLTFVAGRRASAWTGCTAGTCRPRPRRRKSTFSASARWPTNPPKNSKYVIVFIVFFRCFFRLFWPFFGLFWSLFSNNAQNQTLATTGFGPSSSLEVNERDTMAKIREDPMFAIKRKEKEAVTDILNNPLKMKQLKEVRISSSGKVMLTCIYSFMNSSSQKTRKRTKRTKRTRKKRRKRKKKRKKRRKKKGKNRMILTNHPVRDLLRHARDLLHHVAVLLHLV